MPKKITTDGEVIDAPVITEEYKPFFKTPYNHDTSADALDCALTCKDPSMTQQHQTAEADINTITARWLKTGQLPVIPMPPTVADYTNAIDFQEALELVLAAKRSFEQLPGEIRNSFNGDPQQFVAYVDACREAGDYRQLREWGLAAPETPGIENPQNPVVAATPAPPPAPAPSKGA